MNKALGILLGLILLLVPIYVWMIDLWGLGAAALVFLKGAIVWTLILIGALLLLVGLTGLRD